MEQEKKDLRGGIFCLFPHIFAQSLFLDLENAHASLAMERTDFFYISGFVPFFEAKTCYVFIPKTCSCRCLVNNASSKRRYLLKVHIRGERKYWERDGRKERSQVLHSKCIMRDPNLFSIYDSLGTLYITIVFLLHGNRNEYVGLGHKTDAKVLAAFNTSCCQIKFTSSRFSFIACFSSIYRIS